MAQAFRLPPNLNGFRYAKIMDSSQFGKLSGAVAAKLAAYLTQEAPNMVVRETLRFVDDNFRMQGWQGASFQPWAPIKRQGTILVKTGALRRSFNYENRGGGVIYFYNNLPYARAHNEGFKGTVNVRAHTRAKYLKAKASNINTRKVKAVVNKIGESAVGGHTRKMNIIQRQFAPYEGHDSPVLNNAIIKDLEKDIKAILNF